MNLEQHLVQGASGEYSRKIWLVLPPRGLPEKIALFLDGEYYVQQMKAPAILQRLQKRGKIPPMLCAFVSHFDSDARHRDLTCNPSYANFITTDVLHWLREKFAPLPAQNHLIAGASLSGLTATWLALTHPDLFSQCLCQSGSFWWNDEWLKKNLPQMPPGKTKFRFSVGHKETESNVTHGTLRQDASQISACERLVAALKERGHPIHHHVYRGGHDIKPWKNELPEALIWLLAPS
jgi:enterochelin esterase-like enzyme